MTHKRITSDERGESDGPGLINQRGYYTPSIQGYPVKYIGPDDTIPRETRICGMSECGTYIHLETGHGARSARPCNVIALY